MKRRHIAFLILIMGLSAWINHGEARPVNLSAPKGGLGAAGLYGDLELWQEIEGVGLQLDSESYLPLRYKFTSDDGIRGILGPGFYMPMFEAKNVLVREQMMRAFLPCGKGLYLRRDSSEPNKFQTLDKEWAGWLNGDDFTVWRDDGWKLLYHKGHLVSLITDDNHTFAWNYDQGGMPTSVSEDGQSIITIEPNIAGQVAAFIFKGKRYEVTYAERPLTQMLAGQPAIRELAQALSSFKYPDGKMDTFKFVFTQDRVPTLTFTNKDNQQMVYGWDPATNHIASEKGPNGDWTYTVSAVTQEFGVPTITRTNSEHKTESIAIDAKVGTYSKQLADGSKTITTIFESPGPLYNKVRSIEKISDGVTTVIYKAFYDDAGKLIREIDEKGYITTFTYDDQNKLKNKITSLPQDPKVLAKLNEKEKNLGLQIAKITTEEGKAEAIQNLGQFYLFDKLDPQKALNMASQMDHKYAFALRMQVIDYNQLLTPLQKIEAYKDLLKEYPEDKYKEHIEFMIKARQREN